MEYTKNIIYRDTEVKKKKRKYIKKKCCKHFFIMNKIILYSTDNPDIYNNLLKVVFVHIKLDN